MWRPGAPQRRRAQSRRCHLGANDGDGIQDWGVNDGHVILRLPFCAFVVLNEAGVGLDESACNWELDHVS